jgi:hypothetical protein
VPYIIYDEYCCVFVSEFFLPNGEGIIFTTMLWEEIPGNEVDSFTTKLYDDSADWGKIWGDDKECDDGGLI